MSEIAVSKAQIQELRPYLEGDTWAEDGEWAMHCPEHEDGTRSASMNVYIGQWYCQACHAGGSVSELISRRGSWVAPAAGGASRGHTARRSQSTLPSVGSVAGWHEANLDDAYGTLAYLKRRGLTLDTIKKFKIGWNQVYEAYTIPIYNASEKLVNVRYYNPKPTADKGRKMWGVPTHNAPRLFPLQKLNGEVLIGEGEWDIMLTIQHGFPAVTRTAAAKVWKNWWGPHFKDMKVYLCHDMDEAGEEANQKVARALNKYAREIRIVQLPYEVTPKHGKDLTDFWLEHDEGEFEQLIKGAVLFGNKSITVPSDGASDVNLSGLYHRDYLGQRCRTIGINIGKEDSVRNVPRTAHLECHQDQPLCDSCPLNDMEGKDTWVSKPEDIQRLMVAPEKGMKQAILDSYGAKCKHVMVEEDETQVLEVSYVLPPIDESSPDEQAYKPVRMISCGVNVSPDDQNIQVVGEPHRGPKDPIISFVAVEVSAVEASKDRFEITPEIKRLLNRCK